MSKLIDQLIAFEEPRIRQNTANAVQRLQSLTVWKRLNEPRKAVLVNMAYCQGVKAVRAKKDLLLALEREEWTLAGNEFMVSATYFKQPKRWMVLRKQLVTGEWQ